MNVVARVFALFFFFPSAPFRAADARLPLTASEKASSSSGSTKVCGAKSKDAGSFAATRRRFRASAFLRQISSIPVKWLIF